MENKTIGTSHMYPNETINSKHHVPKSINQKIKEYLFWSVAKNKYDSSYTLIYTVILYKKNADLAHCGVTYISIFEQDMSHSDVTYFIVLK